ncbi:MAG: hypothetical protein QOH90_1321 [Actinomycetota bacterium]|nr:hypothetical protein [Actinomycetota bacterium]
MPLPLETERLVVRETRLEDAAGHFEVLGDPEVTAFLPIDPAPSVDWVRERLQARIERAEATGFGMWTVEEKTSRSVVGSCGLVLVEGTGPEIEVAYQFGRKHWGKGYATEAAAACVKYGFDELGLARIVGLTFPDNVASQRVLEKVGLRREGAGEYYGQELLVFAIAHPDAQVDRSRA